MFADQANTHPDEPEGQIRDKRQVDDLKLEVAPANAAVHRPFCATDVFSAI